MNRIENIKKVSNFIGKIGKVFQIAFGTLAGVFLISAILFSLMLAVIMHFIVKIFKRIYHDYSPFLPEVIKDLKMLSVLTTLLILRNSIGLGIISGFIFWGIIELYEYGCELQNQVDETL